MANPWKSNNVWKAHNPFRSLKGWWDLNHLTPEKEEVPKQASLFSASAFTAYEGRPYSFRSLEGQNDGSKDVPVQSTAIASVRFDEDTPTTYVRFVNGDKEYAYKTTPEEMKEFIEAPSKGRLVSKTWNHNPHFHKAV